MTFEDLRVFVTVAAERSFSRAARKLRRTQPAVSQAIRRLEQAAGERLIDRSSRDGTLTDAGELLLDYGTRLVRLADEAATAVADLRKVRSGRVVIGANEGSVAAVLPLIAAFQREYPDVLVEVRIGEFGGRRRRPPLERKSSFCRTPRSVMLVPAKGVHRSTGERL